MRDAVKETYDSFYSYSAERLSTYLYDAFKKDDDENHIFLLSMAADIITDPEQRKVVARALHYKDSVWEILDSGLDNYEKRNT